MVEASEIPLYEKCILFSITCGDYSGTMNWNGRNTCMDNLFNPAFDRLKILGQGDLWNGFDSLGPQNYEVWDLVSPTVEEIDEKFTILANTPERTVAVVYYSGHGCMEIGGSATCAIMPRCAPSGKGH